MKILVDIGTEQFEFELRNGSMTIKSPSLNPKTMGELGLDSTITFVGEMIKCTNSVKSSFSVQRASKSRTTKSKTSRSSTSSKTARRGKRKPNR